ncbi:hypothetical protein Poly51_26900 [Rubripirellula tenax]|uniref:Uncharacterized protein n=1 Tax=Rubripirellula tenax TaxID=2528015 RepID=A0A5C6F4U5_9BACT|nr:hypothetical protein [Rubripirellula tenax]TWU56773.1 hypothetical protein Poly51_26900 [Rubripirellula tenax]
MTADSTTDSATASPKGDDKNASILGGVPQMHAETGYEEIEGVVPLRFSGYVCLLLGLISVVALVGLPALVFPALAIVFGLFALRPYYGRKPAGRTPAMIGLSLAIAFAACGYGVVALKSYTLGSQAKYYTHQYMELVANDFEELAIELGKDYKNRFAETMPLSDFYVNDEEQNGDGADESGMPMESQPTAIDEFRGNGAHIEMRRQGPGADWKLDSPVRVYHQFGIDRAEVNWRADGSDQVVQFFMQYLIDPNDVGQWHIELVQIKRERLVAESIL